MSKCDGIVFLFHQWYMISGCSSCWECLVSWRSFLAQTTNNKDNDKKDNDKKDNDKKDNDKKYSDNKDNGNEDNDKNNKNNVNKDKDKYDVDIELRGTLLSSALSAPPRRKSKV